ncbi:hypothetical protein NLM27_08970 [Bradyrhizobium sp. CCGB12]|uniref:hypothetical protein n=1 Tax=Bradyrhizobium sp. CCGB12 TaxID=2949632 RepID=UPI0020B19CFF|nr:hypothetical protein [Bradyrhizobium sp. CCGB12]MCP3388904.1 hypothetical protein [Bradyrhizobium sp. CCGB12]
MTDFASSDHFRSKTDLGTTTSPSRGRLGIGYVWVGAVLAIVASLPALFAREVFGDDWTVYYIYWTEGAGGLARVLWEAAHAGFAIPMTLFVVALPGMPEVAARLGGLSCHLVNGILLYAIFFRSPQTRQIAALFTALFLLSPFYAIRLTQNAIYDFFLLFYLLSYELTHSKVRALRWAAPFCLLFSLSLETLIACEPLRVVLARSADERWTRTLARLAPFWLAVATVIVLRLTILGKSGHYSGQYGFVPDFAVVGNAISAHLMAFPRGLAYAYSRGFALLGRPVSSILTLAAVVGFVLFSSTALWAPWVLRSRSSTQSAKMLLMLGAAIAVIGALPYALAGVYGDVARGESRLLFPSQLGILILMATGIQAIPGLRVRAAVAGGVITIFALSLAHDSKWLLYDGLFTGDMLRQTRAALLADPEPKVVKLQIEDAYVLPFRSRCLGGNDMNVAQTILRDQNRARSFIYTDFCGDFTNPSFVAGGNCSVSYLEIFPCPPRRETWRYHAAPGIPRPDDIGFVELLTAIFKENPSATEGRGELMQLKDGETAPLARAEYRPPCDRPGVRAAAWLLALPSPACEDPASGAR